MADDVLHRLARVEARLALQELLGRYALAVDDQDTDALGECFTVDGVFGFPNSPSSVGRTAVVAAFRERFSRYGATLHVPQYQVLDRLEETTASGTVVGYAELAAGEDTFVTSFRYDDEYAVESGRWRFRSRMVRTLYAMPLRDLTAGGLSWQARKRWPGAEPTSADLPRTSALDGTQERPPEANGEGVTESGLSKDWEDVRSYTLDEDDETELLRRQTECTLIWAGSQGHPMGVIVNYIFRDGRFWLTSSDQRPRIASLRRDPRVSVAISSKGTDIGVSRSLTYRGTCILHDEAETLRWFVPEFSRAMRPGDPDKAAAFAAHLDSPGRLVLEVRPEKRIGYDAAKMWLAAPAAAPTGAHGNRDPQGR